MYNTLKAAQTLENAGVPRVQAEAHVSIVSEFMESQFATKEDLNSLGAEMRTEFGLLRKDMAILSRDLTIRLGAIVCVTMTAAVTFLKLFS